jgi:hypothetical protein
VLVIVVNALYNKIYDKLSHLVFPNEFTKIYRCEQFIRVESGFHDHKTVSFIFILHT